MKRQFVLAALLLGTSGVAQAQYAASESTVEDRNVAAEFSASGSEAITLFPALSAAASAAAFDTTFAPTVPQPLGGTPADPAPAPDPKFLYGGRDDFRWQLSLGADWLRFRSSIFNASAVGIASGVTYFTNDWFGVEGVFTTGFAPTIYQNEHVKLFVYGGGPKIAWRERRWEPWGHVIFGGAHEFPQTAGHSKSSYAIEGGGGADYRFNPRLSGRLEADWVHTGLFGQNQNNFELMGGVVFHF